MTLIQLQSFLRTAEEMSFTKAAEKLFISRQVVSTHVKTLEEELGYQLFRRGGKSIELTDSGTVLFQRLSAIEEQLESALSDAKMREQGVTELSIGVCEMWNGWEWRLFAFAEAHPNCRIRVERLSQNEVQEGLIQGRFDVVVSLYEDLYEVANTVYAIRHLQPVQPMIVLSKKHPLAKREKLEIRDLDGEKLYCISSEYSSMARPTILGALEQDGARPREISEVPNYATMELALLHDGFGLVFDMFMPNHFDYLKLFPVPQMADIPTLRLSVAYRRDGSSILEELANYLRESGL